MAEIARWHRVVVFPGKHGGQDRRIEFEGKAPTHAETIFMLGQKLLAELRYGERGPDMLLSYVEAVAKARTDEEVRRVVEAVERSVVEKRLVPVDCGPA